MMETATMGSIFERNKEMELRRFEICAQDFFKRWQPEDPDEAARFATEFFMLVRQTYIDAMEPLSRQINDILRSMPMHPWVKP